MLIALTSISLLVWIGLVVFHGGFWRGDQRLGVAPDPAEWPTVILVIPARNEAATIRAVIEGHMASTYPGRMEVVLVDDASDDATADEAYVGAEGGARRLHVVRAPPLEPGWSGKLWALQAGLDHARSVLPEAQYVLLTDADIVHGPDLLGRLVARAEAGGLALVSVMAKLDARGLWGRLLIPAFIFFFQKLYPFPKVNDPASRTAGAAGGVVLVRREALEAIGGLASIRAALIDDCALAARIKHGPPQRRIELVLGDETAHATSLRDNRAFGSIRDMIARTAFVQLDHSALKLAGTLLGMGLVYLVGPLSLLAWPWHGSATAAGFGAATWALMALAFAPTLRLYDQPVWHGLALPLAGALYSWFTLVSAVRHWQGTGGQWKGRTYPGTGNPP